MDNLSRQENKLKKKLFRKDSTLAKQIFEGVDEKYSQLKKVSGDVGKYSAVYSGHLDSLTTALNFVKTQNVMESPALQNSLDRYKELQSKLNSADQVKKYLAQRQQLLREQLEKLGMVKELRKFRKEVYYYQQQIKEYKELFENPSKLEAKLMEMVMKLPQFKDFFCKKTRC